MCGVFMSVLVLKPLPVHDIYFFVYGDGQKMAYILFSRGNDLCNAA